MLHAFPNSVFPHSLEIPYNGNSFGTVSKLQYTTTLLLPEYIRMLSYLRAQLQGSALRVIASLQLTNVNYNHSVTLLKEKYGEHWEHPKSSMDQC